MRSIVLQHVCELGTGDSTKTDEFSEKSFSIQKFMLQILDLKTRLFGISPKIIRFDVTIQTCLSPTNGLLEPCLGPIVSSNYLN